MTTTHEKAELAHDIGVEAQEAQSFWRERDLQWAKVRAMILQAYYQPKKGRENFYSNEPRALTDLGVAILTGKDPILQMPISAEDEEQLLKKAKAERLLEGAFRDIRRNWRRRAHGDWFKELAWFIVTGGYAVFPHVIVTERGDVEFRADLWDPIQVYPDPGHTGMARLYRVYFTSYNMALSMATANKWDVRELGKDGDRDEGRWRDNEVRVVNKWWMDGKQVMNAVVFNDLLVKKPTHEKTMKRIPIIAGPSDGVPYRDYSHEQDFPLPAWQSQWGIPLISANMDLYEQFDRLISWMMQITKDHAQPTYLDINEEGTLTVDANADLGKMKVIPRKVGGEDFRAVPPPTSPREREELLSYLIGALQRGGLSHVAFGSLGLEISGVTLQQLLTATRSKLLPYIQTSEDVLSETMMELLAQFKALGRPVSLAVRNREQGPGGAYFIEDFEPDYIPESSYVQVQLPLALPDDTMERITAARQALGTNEPLMDWFTAADKLLLLQDPNIIRNRMDDQLANRHPAMVAFRTVFGMKQQAKRKVAEAQLDLLQRDELLLAANLLDQLADATLAQVAATIAGAGGGPNAQGTPAKTPEPRSSEMPAEAGPLNPDLFNLAFGRAATTPQRPVTIQDRLRNMGLEHATR